MANSFLNPNIVTKEALRVLHQKLNAVGNMNRQYDSRFSLGGAKGGTNLDVRLPPKFTTGTGATATAQNIVDRKVDLPRSTQRHVFIEATSLEVTSNIDDYSRQYLEPAMSQLAADMEFDVLDTVYKQVAQYGGTPATQANFSLLSQGREILSRSLAPSNDRACIWNPRSTTNFLSDTKGLFQSSDNISEQYREGMLGRIAGFDNYENTLVPNHTPGTYGGTPLVDGASQGSAGTGNEWVATTTLSTDGWTSGSTTLNAGDIFTIDGVFDVHPETKQSTGILKRFAVQETVSDTSGSIDAVIAPAIIAGGAYQNVDALPADNAAITVVGVSATTYQQSLAFQKDAFIFVTADLEDMSKYGNYGAREVMDGISMRMYMDTDITNDKVQLRFDVLYGAVASYPELAVRLLNQA